MRVTPARSDRPAIVYLEPGMGAEFFRSCLSPWQKSLRGVHKVELAGVCLTRPVDFQGLKFPKGTIVVEGLKQQPGRLSREQKLQYGSTLVHELAHSKGAGEFKAFSAEAGYLSRNGVRVIGPHEIIRRILRLPGYINEWWHSAGEYLGPEATVGARLSIILNAWVKTDRLTRYFQKASK